MALHEKRKPRDNNFIVAAYCEVMTERLLSDLGAPSGETKKSHLVAEEWWEKAVTKGELGDFPFGLGGALAELAKGAVRADQSKRMNFDKTEATKSSCPSCGGPLGDLPYHMSDGRVVCNGCGVEEALATRGKPVRV